MLRREFLAGLALMSACSQRSSTTTSEVGSNDASSGSSASDESRALAQRAQLRAKYKSNVEALEATRKALQARWRTSAAPTQREKLEKEARQTLLGVFDTQLFPAWIGTPWDYNGTSQEPGAGAIACGYLVTTLLRDAGVRLERARLAQQVSETIVKTLCLKEDIARYRRGDVTAVVRATREKGDGLYVVGLDHHVGFLRVSAANVRFWHTTFERVADENAEVAPGFVSNYHVVGKLFVKMDRWLSGGVS